MNRSRTAHSSHRSGFTLVELLVVLGIIALLAALFGPVLSAVRNASRNTVCQSNLKQIGAAIQAYAQDWDGVYPLGLDFADASQDGLQGWMQFPTDLYPNAYQTVAEMANRPNRGGYIDQVLKPYTKAQSIWHCPADIGLQYQQIVDASGIIFYHGDTTNGQPAYDVYDLSYGYRTELGLVGWTVDQAKSVSDLVVLADMAGYWHTKFHRASQTKSIADTSDTVKWSLNVLYGDGHVRNTTWPAYTQEWSTVGPLAEWYLRQISSSGNGTLIGG